MPKFDVTKLNVAIERQLEVTKNPRHRFLLQAYSRHRYLEVAGRYEEIFAADMMAMEPSYHFSQGGNDMVLKGQDQVKSLYRFWAETNQSIFLLKMRRSPSQTISSHPLSMSTSRSQARGSKRRN